MAGSLNQVMLIGNVGRDPEIRTMQNGGRVANLSLATSESWKDKDSGERKEQTEWHRVVVMNDQLVLLIEQYVRKGSKIYVQGKIQTRKWTDQTGTEKYSTEIMLGRFDAKMQLLSDPAGERQGPPADQGYGGGNGQARQQQPAQQGGRPGQRVAAKGPATGPQWDSNKPLDEDDIPF
jgi:single-strand DNA-binding protein